MQHTIFEKIKKIIDKPVEEIRDLHEAYWAYSWNELETNNRAGSISDVINQFDQTTITESSFTKQLCEENVTDLCTWSFDKNSVNFMRGIQNIDGQEVEIPKSDLEMLEDRVRMSISKDDVKYFFGQMLIAGYALASVGLKDRFFVPDSRDVTGDYKCGDYMFYKRKMDKDSLFEALNVVVQVDDNDFEKVVGIEGWEMDDPEIAMAVLDSKITTNSNDEIEITHGQYRKSFDEYCEFVKVNDVIFVKRHPEPVLFIQSFNINKDNKEYQGIFSMILSEEYQSLYLYSTIIDRRQKVIDAALLVRTQTLDTPTIDRFYKNGILAIDDAALNTASGPAFEFTPSRAEEIPLFREELNTLFERARAITGLYQRPNTISTTDTSAHEAVAVWQTATKRVRGIIEDFAHIFAKVLKIIAERELQVPTMIECEYVNNPLDDREKSLEAKEALEKAIGMITADPLGTVTGGQITPDTINYLLRTYWRGNRFDMKALQDPKPTPLTNEALMKQAEAKQEEPLVIAAQAEDKKAEADLLEAQVKQANLDIQMGIDNNKTTIELIRLQIEAQKNNDETALKMIEMQVNAMQLNAKKEKINAGKN